MTCSNNNTKKGVAMAPVSVGTTAPKGKRDYTQHTCGNILTAVRALTKNMVAKPEDVIAIIRKEQRKQKRTRSA